MEDPSGLMKSAIEDAVKSDMETMFGPAKNTLQDPYFKESLNMLYGVMKAHFDHALANGFDEKQALTIVAKLMLGISFGQ